MLLKLVFVRNPLEHAVRLDGNVFLLVGVYVDDLTIIGSSTININAFKDQGFQCIQRTRVFSMSDPGYSVTTGEYMWIERKVQQICLKAHIQ